MININDFKEFVYNVANKSGRGTVSPSQFNTFVNRAVMGYYNKNIEVTSNGLPFSKNEINQLSIDRFADIKTEVSLLSNLGEVLVPNGVSYDLKGNIAPKMWHYGYMTFNYSHKKNGLTIWEERPIETIKDNEWGKRVSSTIVAPTLKRPIVRRLGGVFMVRPKAITNINLTYLRYPNEAKWEYTVVNNRPVYDSVNSIDIEAPYDAFNEIAMLTLEFMGIRLRERELVEMANLK